MVLLRQADTVPSRLRSRRGPFWVRSRAEKHGASRWCVDAMLSCEVDLSGDPRVLLTVRVPGLVAAIRHSDVCPFDLVVDRSLRFLTLGVDPAARPPFVFFFDRRDGGVTRADARAAAIRVLHSPVTVRFEDTNGLARVEWPVDPTLGSGDSWWRQELLRDVA